MCERYFRPRAFRRHLEWCHEKQGGGRKGNRRTLENDSLIWSPDVAKSPCTPICLKKYTARLIGENTNPLILKVVDWVGSEVAHIGLRRCGEIRGFVEVRVLVESKTSVILEAAEVPKNFL